MIATGLVFLLGALVATLLALLFVPLLWRNAQRLARRDFAATMPASMNEIRAEVDRVRAEAAMTVRQHEISVRKARDQAASERAKLGRLTAGNAELTFLADQRSGEANALRGQIAGMQERLHALEEARSRLEGENAELKAALASSLDHGQTLAARLSELETAETANAAPKGPDAVPAPQRADETMRTTADDEARERVMAAAAALIALSAERAGREGETAQEHREGDAAQGEVNAAEHPDSPGADRERQNADVRERIAGIAANVIQMTGLKEGAASPLSRLIGSPAPAGENTDMPPSLADRVRRVTAARPAPPQPDAVPTDATGSEETPSAEVAPVTSPAGRKQRRGGGRSRPRSPR